MSNGYRRAPHALAIPLPAQGHINPLMQLCDRLASTGFVITFLNTNTVHDQMLKNNCKSKEELESESFRFMSVPDEGLPQSKLLGNLDAFLTAAEKTMKEEVEKIIEQLMEDPFFPPVTCIIADPFFAWTENVAERFGICKVCFWTSSATFAVVVANVPLLFEKGLVPVKEGEEKIIDFLRNVPPIPTKYLPPRFHEGGSDGSMKSRMSINKSDAWVLVNSFYDLEKEQFDHLQEMSPAIVSAGPLIPLNGRRRCVWEEEISCMEWLDQQRATSVLYISFGSMATLSLDDILELAVALERSECAFLWVVRLDLIESQEENNELFSRLKQSKRGMFISWAPQLKVLQHKSVAAFLTHCGWNSLMEAVASGVPILGWPCFAEQKLNSMFAVEQWKVGFPAYTNNKATTSEIEKMIRKITGVEGYEPRKKMESLSSACVKAVNQGGSSYTNLQAFFADMQNRANSY